EVHGAEESHGRRVPGAAGRLLERRRLALPLGVPTAVRAGAALRPHPLSCRRRPAVALEPLAFFFARPCFAFENWLVGVFPPLGSMSRWKMLARPQRTLACSVGFGATGRTLPPGALSSHAMAL